MILVGSLRCIIPQIAKLRIKSEILAVFHIKVRKEHFMQVQLASAKLAICLKNSVFGFEKLSFFLGLRLSFFATFLMY